MCFSEKQKSLVLFDGYCHLCSRTVRFILKNDKKKQFLFTPLDSEKGIKLKTDLNISEEIDSVIIIDGGQVYFYSSAFFLIIRRLGGWWNLFLVFQIVPRTCADRLYRYIAKKRFKWFGRQDDCFFPGEDYKDRFI